MRYVFAALLLVVLTGCAGQVRVAQLPTEEERCLFGGGVYRSGLCDYCK